MRVEGLTVNEKFGREMVRRGKDGVLWNRKSAFYEPGSDSVVLIRLDNIYIFFSFLLQNIFGKAAAFFLGLITFNH